MNLLHSRDVGTDYCICGSEVCADCLECLDDPEQHCTHCGGEMSSEGACDECGEELNK